MFDAAFWCGCRRTGLRARTKLERTLKLGQSLLRRGEISALKFAADGAEVRRPIGSDEGIILVEHGVSQ